MNTTDSSEGPKMTFLQRGKEYLSRVQKWLYVQIFSYTYILERLKRLARKSSLSIEQEKRLTHFVDFISGPENTDILENLCTMKTSKRHDMLGLLECLEKAETEEKIGPQFVMDTILLFYHAPTQKKLSKEERSAFCKLKNILIKRVPKVKSILPNVPEA